MSTGLPAISSSRCCACSSNTAVWPPAIDSTIDRQRSSRRGFGTIALVLAREQLFVVDLLEHERRVAFGGPDLRRAAAPPPFGGIEREHAQQGVKRRLRHLADEHHVQQIAIVQQRRGFGDRGFVAVGRRAFDQQRLGRDANREHRAHRRLLNRVGQTCDRRARRSDVRADRASSCAPRPAARARAAATPARVRARAGTPGTRRNYKVPGARCQGARCWVPGARCCGAGCWRRTGTGTST